MKWPVLLLLAALPLRAAEPEPTPELLEFLGEWTDDQGRAIDPFFLPKLNAKSAMPQQDSGDDDEKEAR